MQAPYIQLKEIGLTYDKDQKDTIRQFSLDIKEGEFISIVGKSGCGKTSLLQMVAGMQKPTTGLITISGHEVKEPVDELSYVFQKPILLEWKTILENVLLPLQLKRKLTEKDTNKAMEMLDRVGLTDAIHKFPYECSGGMQSRVAIVRALLNKPQTLLMDEPFSALDTFTRDRLHVQLNELIDTYKPTVLFVTHDLQEAFFLSDRIILLGGKPGRILQEYQVPFTRPRQKSILFDPSFYKFQQDMNERLQS
jgi:NitT/TauT family transport system ATP-binding protein